MANRAMDILFYVEPHGVRDTFTAHTLPFEYFRMIAAEIYAGDDALFDGVEARIFCNHFVADMKLTENYKDWPFVLQPKPAERRQIEDSATMWMMEGMNAWITLMRDETSPLAQQYAAMLRRIKAEDFDFDVIVCWGENAAVRAIAKEFGITPIYLELASMRAPFPRSVFIDPTGVNGAASTTKWNVDLLDELIAPLPQELIPVLMNEELSPGQQSSTIPQARFAQLSSRLRNFLATDERIALVPLQLADDANQLLYSTHLTVDDFVDHAVEPLLEAGFRVIMKAHPSAEQRGGYVMSVQRRCLRRYANNPRVHILDTASPPSEYLAILDSVDLVVTNNSSVGFEAMMLGRRVVALGRACYAPVGALPTLPVAIDCLKDQDLDKHWSRKAGLDVTYLLGNSFPLSRRLGRELVLRADLWRSIADPQDDAASWLKQMVDTIAWSTWSQQDLLRTLTRRT